MIQTWQVEQCSSLAAPAKNPFLGCRLRRVGRERIWGETLRERALSGYQHLGERVPGRKGKENYSYGQYQESAVSV